MLQSRLHIHDDHVIFAVGQIGQHGLEHHMLRADAAAATQIHGAHDQQLYAVDLTGEGVGNVSHIGVELEELVGGVGAGAFFH